MNISEYKKMMNSKSKYHNRKFENAYGKWDSEAEYRYFLLLKDREKKGEISNLGRQVRIEIQPAFTDLRGNKVNAIHYVADFVYHDEIDHRMHYIDVKGMRTDVYKLKKKLLAFRGIEIEEVTDI